MPRLDPSTDPRSYTCDQCGGTFLAGRDDEEAQQEAVEAFGKRGDDPSMAIVCHTCYLKIMAWARGRS